MKIVNIAAEIAPFAKTGGLAEVTGALPVALQAAGHEVVSFLPCYQQIDLEKWGFQMVVDQFEVPLGSDRVSGRIFCSRQPDGHRVYLIDNGDFFNRDELYGTAMGDYPDNDRRFVFFQKAVLETLKAVQFTPDIIHCHDWQTGLVPVYLKTLYANDPVFKKVRSIFTIHNLGFQGNFPPDSLPATGLGWDLFKLEGLEFYGKVSFLKGGIIFADKVTTVGERYAEDIQSKEFGSGLEGVLKNRGEHLSGIVSGIDTSRWNPSVKDKDLSATYDVDSLEGKWKNKETLQRENEMTPDRETPIVGMVSRLVDRKGMDILLPALAELSKLGVYFVLLGTGDEKYHKILREIGKKNRKNFGIHIVFDPKMAKQIYAGSDILLIPSYHESCGLAQMIALRYGTIPIGRKAGGVADMVSDFDPRTGKGNGFLFEDYSSEALVGAVTRAIHEYHNKKSWGQLIRNAMASDVSWKASAEKYIKVFEQSTGKKLRSPKK